jgi:hypothetical protein
MKPFDFFAEVDRVNKAHVKSTCPKCLGSGLIFVSVNAWGDRISEICKCPAGDSDRRFVDMSERQIARDERARDIGSDEDFNW